MINTFLKFLSSNKKNLLFLSVAGLFLTYIFINHSFNNELFFNGGDESRHALNGVFYLDFFADGGWSHPTQFFGNYPSRYTALSPHLIQPVFYLWEAFVFFLFGVSLFSTKLSVALLALVTIVFYFFLIRRFFNSFCASIATLLFVTNIYFLTFASHVMLEVPGICFLVVNSFLVFSASRKVRFLGYLFLLFAPFLLSHKLFFLFPFTVTYLVLKARFTWPRFFAVTFGILSACLLIGMVLRVSHASPLLVRLFHLNALNRIFDLGWWASGGNIHFYFKTMLGLLTQLGFWMWLVALLVAIKTRLFHKNLFALYSLLLVFWCLAANSFFCSFFDNRFLLYVIPFCVFLIGWLIATKFWKKNIVAKAFGLLIVIIISFAGVIKIPSLHYVRGYEKAANIICGLNLNGAPILFDGYQDGNFEFFVRVHSRRIRPRVIRGDKTIFISKFDWNKWNLRGTERNEQEIFQILDQNNIRYVASESLSFGIPSQELLKKILLADSRFKKIIEVPIDSSVGPNNKGTFPGYKNSKIIIFEFLKTN